MLLVLVGARGAGKTTLQGRLKESGVEVLIPSTTREPRFEGETEYDFVTSWRPANYAWSIDVGKETYGMRRSELAKAKTRTCVTVFEPLRLEVFEQKRRELDIETMTIGLATIADPTEQRRRVGDVPTRTMSDLDFERATKVVSECDLVLSGDAETIASAVLSLIRLMEGRGGVVTKDHLSPLIRAGGFLTNTKESNIKPASYDLRIGHEILCQGKVVELSPANPRFEIPPYSYAIVSALEYASLPPCVVGRFDLKVSYFFEGVILSNGPQVDPGYKGALFCMLYNGSGRPRLLTLGKHFATIDFTTTTNTTEGYRQKYQLKQRMGQFLTDESVTGRGGAIVELIDRKVAVVDEKVGAIKRNFWTIAGAVIAIAVVVPALVVPVAWIELGYLHTEKLAIDDAQRRTTELLQAACRERLATAQLLAQAGRRSNARLPPPPQVDCPSGPESRGGSQP